MILGKWKHGDFNILIQYSANIQYAYYTIILI